MEVSAIRADEDVPVTKTDITREELEARYHGQDLPLLMRDAPSISAYSESGVGGAGYSYITLRGISPSRINFTLDGVPLADSEDMTTYFADFPDLARSLQSIQIQRGVGTSTFGSASFGGSVNLESIDVASTQQIDATLGLGSFGNRQVSIGYHSGMLPRDFAFYTRLSYLQNEGFRHNSAMEQRNLFFSGTKVAGNALFKLSGFSGHEKQQLSFYATDEATLKDDPRSNPLRPEERDAFGYDLAQLQYIRPLDSNADMTASVYYQRGYGWYRLYDFGTDVLAQYGLDGMLMGSILTYSRAYGNVTTNYGVHVNRFKRDHTRDALGSRDYANYGTKGEANAFAKVQYDAGSWSLYGDAQVRHANFEYHGDQDLDAIDWTFFNPKIGARYALGANASVYASAGYTTREPARNDMFFGEDNPTLPYDLRAVRPERVMDFEAGWSFRRANVDFAANVYAMEFRNEIALTGELSEIGLPLRRNVDRSHRRGIELEATWRVRPQLRLQTSANFSSNQIEEWTQVFDVYDDAGNWIDTRSVRYANVEPLLTPSVLLNQSITYTPDQRLLIGATGRYVGESYLDNTNGLEAPSFFLLDMTASYAVTPRMRLTLQVNNALGADRVYPSGYSYLYYTGDVQSGTAYYYPQATRNAVVLMDFDF
jgi:iron complex outermembrane receptor protein